MQRIPPFPIQRPTYDSASDAFGVLCKKSGVDIILDAEWNSKSELNDKLNLVLPIQTIGMETSNHYAHPIRMACDSNTSASPIRSWFNPKIHKSVASSVYYEKSHKSALALRKYIPAQFRPIAAKALFEKFNAKRVYDPCGGWGDRLVGALATDTVEHYHARDVNPLLFPVYSMICDDFDPKQKASFELQPAELDSPASEYFDFVFTSPPYWLVEKYYGEGQSWKEYKRFDDWMENFLFRMMDNCWESLAKGGHMAINISDCYARHTMNRICQPMIDYCVKNLTDCKYIGSMGYQLATRPNNKNGYTGIHAEPIIIFQK